MILRAQTNFVEFLEQVLEVLKEVEIDKTECSTLLASVQKQQLVIPVVGNFSAGKSTLLNRFLEKSVLPTGITPETSLATELHYSANERIEAFSNNDEKTESFELNEQSFEAIKENEIFKLNLIYKIITLLLYQKSTELTLKNVSLFIKAHILFSILPSFFFFLKALIHDLILTKTSFPLLQYNYAENFFRFLFNYRIHGSSKA
nr:dynamin family protein [Helicobacter pylori]